MSKNNRDIIVADIFKRLEFTFELSESGQKNILWYNSVTTLLEQCQYECKESLNNFFEIFKGELI